MSKYVAYYRVSTKKQGDSGLGLEAQKSAISQYVGSGKLLAEFTEIESGSDSQRKELAKALNHCKLTNSTLVIAKLDRLSRNVAFLADLMESDVKFIAADSPSATNLTIHILAAVAQEEVEAIRRRTKAALQAAKERGVVLGNPNLHLVRNADTKAATEARSLKASEWKKNMMPIIESIKESGITTLQGIADELNARGFLTRKNASFQANSVRRLI